MPEADFDPTRGLILLGELVRLTATPAGLKEICDQGLALAVRALRPARATFLLRRAPGEPAEVVASSGPPVGADLIRLGERALAAGAPVEDGADASGFGSVALPLPGEGGMEGALALERPLHWSPAARLFAQEAARVIAAALAAARVIEEIRDKGELLVKRNVELEILRDFAGRLQDLGGDDEEILLAALDLVLERLGLQAGWIFWGEAERDQLELAVARGVAEEFVREARESGIAPCLCRDVFQTGRLRMARNTTECPRLPDLVRGSGPISHACIPLKFEHGVLGVMNIANRPGQLFTAEELQFMETLGHQVSLAVDKARSARAERRRNAEARALAALTLAIGGSLEQERVLAAVGRYGRELLAADRCGIFMGADPGALLFAFLAGPPLPEIEVGRTVDLLALGSRALVRALREREVMVIEDASADPRGKTLLARRLDLGSAIIVPLLAHERLEGLLVASRSRPSTWSPGDVELARTLAGHAALAIENARLYREAQEALVRLQEVQYGMMKSERLATIGTLASSLAHEVRNPLNSISLQLVLLSRRVARGEPALQREIGALIETARGEIARLDDLVNEFLSLSTLDRLSLVETNPADVAREVMVLMAPVARERGVRVREDHTEALPSVPLDREKMKQVLINLVRNAIEAMPNEGALQISSRFEDGAVVIRVGDTGVGIQKGLDVFNFFMTTKRGGTGLGLPIARGIVEAHGGTLTYESEPGRGTVFSVALKVPESSAGEVALRGKP